MHMLFLCLMSELSFTQRLFFIESVAGLKKNL